MPVYTKATYKGEANRDGKKLEAIALELTANTVDDGGTVFGPFTFRRHEGKGSIVFDNASGWLVETEQSQVVDMVAGAGPGQMIVYKVKLSLSAKLAEPTPGER
jgi:hypothetical protein